MNKAHDNPFEDYNAQTNGELRKFSDLLLQKYKGKILEIYIGDQSETINFEEYSIPKNCSIFGVLKDVLDRFIVLDCYYIDPVTKHLVNENDVFINSFQIRVMTELDGKGSLKDVFASAGDADRVRKQILEKLKR